MIRVCPRNPSRMRRPTGFRVITKSAIISLDNLAPSARLPRFGRATGCLGRRRQTRPRSMLVVPPSSGDHQ